MRTIRKINRPIKFFGLSSTGFAVFMLVNALIIIVSIFKQLHPLLIVGVISLIFFVSARLFKKLREEHKAGNPDYLAGLSVKSSTPKKILDKHHIFNFIIQKI